MKTTINSISNQSLFNINTLKRSIMKTKILIIASLFFAGMVFTSCQKDNSLMDEQSFQQSGTVSTLNSPANQAGGYDLHPDEILKSASSAGDPGPVELGEDMISNYPDPFTNTTEITYFVPGGKTVSLQVFKNGTELVAVLVDNEDQEAGEHVVKFNATGLSPGLYIAELRISSEVHTAVYKERMTKKAQWQEDGDEDWRITD